MPLTPADVHNVTFSKPPIGKRGYKEDEVDVFLDLVGAELARLIEVNKDLRDEVERLGQQPRTALAGRGTYPLPAGGTSAGDGSATDADERTELIRW